MPLTEDQLHDNYQVCAEFVERYKLQQFQTQIKITEFQAPTGEWMAGARSSRIRAGASTADQYTIVLDKDEHEQQLRNGLSTPGKKGKFVKLYVAKIVVGGEENLQWPIGRVDF